MAEATAAEQKNLGAEIERRKAILAAQDKLIAEGEAKHMAHLANLGKDAKPIPKTPRHIELAALVAAELAGVSIEEFSKLRREGKLPDAAKEAMSVIPQPARDQLQLAEFTNCDRRLVAPADVDPRLLDDNRRFWSILSDQLSAFDLIRVIAPDRSWYAEYVVTECGENTASARLLRYIDIEPAQKSSQHEWLPDGFELIALGPEHPVPGFAIKRLRDGHLMLSSGMPFPDVESARRHLKDHAVFKKDEITKYLP